MNPMQEMFWDTYDRAFHSTGHPPERMWANVGFKQDLMDEMEEVMKYSVTQENWASNWQWKPMPPYRVEYHGVKIDCVLNAKVPTLFCTAVS